MIFTLQLPICNASSFMLYVCLIYHEFIYFENAGQFLKIEYCEGVLNISAVNENDIAGKLCCTCEKLDCYRLNEKIKKINVINDLSQINIIFSICDTEFCRASELNKEKIEELEKLLFGYDKESKNCEMCKFTNNECFHLMVGEQNILPMIIDIYNVDFSYMGVIEIFYFPPNCSQYLVVKTDHTKYEYSLEVIDKINALNEYPNYFAKCVKLLYFDTTSHYKLISKLDDVANAVLLVCLRSIAIGSIVSDAKILLEKADRYRFVENNSIAN